MPGLNGKTVKLKSKVPQEDTSLPIPSTVVEQFKEGVTLFVELMHINNIVFLVSKASHMNYYQCVPI